ncbi:hypothetical protein, partial [Hyphomonas sp.]|uniref:hypothetical protein n=1 Tax=Hyphomonas sp. TaxID=87 RepID=UPI0032423CC9
GTQYYNTLSRLTSKGKILKDDRTKSYMLPRPDSVPNEDSPTKEAGLFADEVAPASNRKAPKGALH